ncbi:Leucine-rich repeat [Parasponia andersonii]|uniref:Leucine-rich repeat n=1 Tax=Parasponia andersonii TaxID=3476 RepID=A0A2P5C2T4_PARAD|nr:Leucine-rich repeat [Parasponia andersonii]
MYNLKYLKFFSSFGSEKYLRFPESLDSFPDELRYLGWNSYPYKSLPTDFKATNLVELNLRGSELNDLWNGVQDLANLKALDLAWSKNLIQIPDLSLAVKLETLDLSYCESLNNLPSSIGKLESLQSLNVSWSEEINEFPELALNIRDLHMTGTSIKKVPSSIERLFHLHTLRLSCCKRLNSLPTTITKLISLQKLHLDDCPRLEYLPPQIISEHITDQFQIDGSGIGELPSSIENLGGFQSLLCLEQSGCSKLENLPPLFNLKLDGSNVSEIPDWFFRLPLLYDLDLSKTRIRTVPAGVGVLASCLVVAPEVNGESNSYPLASSFMLVCVINVQSHLGERRIEYESSITMTTLRTNHVLMWYFRTSKIDLFSAREISFDFRIEKPDLPFASSEDQFANYKLEMEKCGVRMLQPRDAVEFGIISSSGDFVRGESHVVTNEL